MSESDEQRREQVEALKRERRAYFADHKAIDAEIKRLGGSEPPHKRAQKRPGRSSRAEKRA